MSLKNFSEQHCFTHFPMSKLIFQLLHAVLYCTVAAKDTQRCSYTSLHCGAACLALYLLHTGANTSHALWVLYFLLPDHITSLSGFLHNRFIHIFFCCLNWQNFWTEAQLQMSPPHNVQRHKAFSVAPLGEPWKALCRILQQNVSKSKRVPSRTFLGCLRILKYPGNP